MTPQAKQLAELLKQKRIRAGLSQRDVSDALGYSTPQFISNWERGISTPPMDAIPKLAEIYLSDIEDLGSAIIEFAVADYRAQLVRKFAGHKGRLKQKAA